MRSLLIASASLIFFLCKALFVHPVDDYDFVIQLDPAVLPRYSQNVTSDPTVWSSRKGQYANLPQEKLANEDGDIRPGFDPAQLLFDDFGVSDRGVPIMFVINADDFGLVYSTSIKIPLSSSTTPLAGIGSGRFGNQLLDNS